MRGERSLPMGPTMYLVLLATAVSWLAVVVLVITACQAAARADAGPRPSPPRRGGQRSRRGSRPSRRVAGGAGSIRRLGGRASRSPHTGMPPVSACSPRQERGG
jgi:hypothetical protein